MSWGQEWSDLCFASFPIRLNPTRHIKGAHVLFFRYVFKFMTRGLELIMCPNIHLCLKEELPILSAETGQRKCQAISNQALSWISTPAQSLPSPDLQWGGVGDRQTISGNLNLFKVTERVRETDWHWWDQTRTVRCCAALRPGLTSLIDRVWWDCHWARRAAER